MLPVRRVRLEAVDLLRGLLMLFMALDHTRDYFTNIQINPTDPTQSWPMLFATRWITHLCAPGFMALCGTSIFLQKQRGKTVNEVSRLLATRGLWVLLIDLTLISFGWSFTFLAPFPNIISTFGICMIVLALLQRLPTAVVGGLGAAILLLHNLLTRFQPENPTNLWIIFHERGFLTFHGHPLALMYFPVVPWIGFMCVGYTFGPLLMKPYAFRRRVVLALSFSFFIVFTGLRLLNGYGDNYRFEHLGTFARTAMSFMQVQKYPASLDYALATLGVNLLLFAGFDAAVEHGWMAAARRFLVVYGRVPFLFYVLHIYLVHSAALITTYAIHLNWHMWIGRAFIWEEISPDHWGYGLPVVYAVWIAVCLLLYLPCRWFSELKARRRDWWLSYL
jgi:uncharacterized membrane protein